MRGPHWFAAVLLAGGLLSATRLTAHAQETVCGPVIAVECRTESGRVQLVISKAGASEPLQVEVDAKTDTDGLATERQYLFRPVCASNTATATGVSSATVTITGAAAEPADSPWRAARLCDASITPPRLVRHVNLVPPPATIAHQKLGTVWLDVLVDGTGRVEDARVTHSIDREFGGDAAAFATVKQWAFTPATRNGQPLSVVVIVLMTFAVSQ